MLIGYNPVFQAFLGTLFTWGLTAAGAALVFVFSSGQRKILDGSLGFAAGVMTAASYWSLLAPAIEMAEMSGLYGEKGQWAFLPVAIGFILGAVFVYGADQMMPQWGISDPSTAFALETCPNLDKRGADSDLDTSMVDLSFQGFDLSPRPTHRRHANAASGRAEAVPLMQQYKGGTAADQRQLRWRRILLLIVAITVHNIPEGLAVGVGFGAIGKTPSATYENARNLAIGIGIQNFPEGLAVSLPLRGSGMSVWNSFFYGQLSGMVEPVAGLIGAAAVIVAEPVLPYALAFAAGAMIYVVVDDIIPEAHTAGNGKLASLGSIVGFVVMMSLDVGLG